jgi:predicted phosphodiesterase
MRRLPHTRLRAALARILAVAASANCAGRIDPIDPTTIAPPSVTLPLRPGSARFAVIGDSGTGGAAQYRVAAQLTAAHAKFPFEFVIMAGDNMYGSQGAADYETKFAIPYKRLLDGGVKFYAALGNHDDTNQVLYEPFNMGGQRFYTFRPKGDLRFFALDSNYMSPEQLEWLEKELSASTSAWKIAFFHHPIYSEGRHGSDIRLRQALEPLFVKYGIDVVFVGHEHFYERIKPQQGVHYFTSGGAAKLRRGDIDREADFHAAGFDQGYHFMLVEIVDDELYFQVITDDGRTVDAGMIQRRPDPQGPPLTTPAPRRAPTAN